MHLEIDGRVEKQNTVPAVVGPSSSQRAVAIVRLGRFRYLSIMITPFIVGFLASRSKDYTYLALGVVAIILYQAINSIGNCISDRVEDQIDYPARTHLVQLATLDSLRRVVLGCLAVYLGIVAAMAVPLGIQLDTIALWLLYLAGTFAYSFARVKTTTFGPPVLSGALSAAMFWVGFWGFHDAFAAINDVHFLALGHLRLGDVFTGPLALIAPAILVLWMFGGSLCGSKDVPNLKGDAAIGYESIYFRIVRGTHALLRVIIVMSLPYLLACVFIIAGYSQPAPWVLLGYPLAPLFALVLVRAAKDIELELVRESGYIYWQIFMSLILLSVRPSIGTSVLLVASLGWWLVMSRVLQPDPTVVKFENAVIVGKMIVRRSQT